jgi:hypothetical protein
VAFAPDDETFMELIDLEVEIAPTLLATPFDASVYIPAWPSAPATRWPSTLTRR